MRVLGWYAVVGLFVAGLFWLRVAHLAHTDPSIGNDAPELWWHDVIITVAFVALWPFVLMALLATIGIEHELEPE